MFAGKVSQSLFVTESQIRERSVIANERICAAQLSPAMNQQKLNRPLLELGVQDDSLTF